MKLPSTVLAVFLLGLPGAVAVESHGSHRSSASTMAGKVEMDPVSASSTVRSLDQSRRFEVGLVSLDDPILEEASIREKDADKLIKPCADDNLRLRRTKKGDPRPGPPGSSKDKDSDKGLEGFKQCYESCGVEWPLGSSGSSGSSGTSSSSKQTWENKPACCQGGVSAIRASYIGQSNATFYVANHDSMGGAAVVDQCGVGGGSSLDFNTVRFADCDKCFPSQGQNLSLCDPATDIWDYILLKTTDEFCLVVLAGDIETLALDTKMPTDLKMLYQDGETPGVVVPITFHTSCSRPVYPPYAIDLEACNGDDNFYIDLSLVGQPPSSLLKFEDGFGAKEFPSSLFSTCEIPNDTNPRDADQCCQGGATFLETKFGGSELVGILTMETSTATVYASCVLDAEPSSKDPSQEDGLPIRFVPCSDECLLDPFGDVPCSSSFESVGVLENEDVCFGKWDNVTSRIAYDAKMPTNLDIYLINEDGVFSARIHTSCSNPVYAPFAQGFSEACSSSEPLPVIDLSVEIEEELPIHLAFIDGTSRNYFESASQLDTGNDENVKFDISFEGCGCFCGSDFPSFAPTYFITHSPSAQPSALPASTLTLAPSSPPSSSPSQVPSAKLSVSPSDELTTSPSNTPSQAPSSQPTASSLLSPGAPTGGDCGGNLCKDWVSNNCVFFRGSGTGDACDVDRVFPIDDQVEEQGDDEQVDDEDGDNRRRLLKSSMHALITEENEAIGVWPLNEQIEYHREMAAFYKELLSFF